MTAPTPLSPGSAKLARRRYHVNVHGARNERGAYPFIAEARFTSEQNAREWADAVHPDAPLVNVTLLSARDGWRAHPAAERIDGRWA